MSAGVQLCGIETITIVNYKNTTITEKYFIFLCVCSAECSNGTTEDQACWKVSGSRATLPVGIQMFIE